MARVGMSCPIKTNMHTVLQILFLLEVDGIVTTVALTLEIP